MLLAISLGCSILPGPVEIPEPPVAQIEIGSHPEGALVVVQPTGAGPEHGGVPFVALTPWAGEVPAGPVALRFAAPGRRSDVRALAAQGEVRHDEWLDPSDQVLDLQRVVPTGNLPKGVLVMPDGQEMWVTLLGGPPSVRVHALPGGEVLGDIALGKSGTVELELSKDGERVYASQMESAKVYEIDRRTRELLRTFDTRSLFTKVLELSADGKHLFASNWEGDNVSEIDLATGKVRLLPTVVTPRGLYASSDGKTLYVAGFGDGNLDRIDIATGRRRTLHLGGAPRHIVADESRDRLYVSDMAKSRVFVLSLADPGKEPRELAKVCEKPNTIDLSPDGRLLFVSCRGANGATYLANGPEWGSVLALDADTGEVLDAIVGGNQCTALDVSDDGKLLVFSDFRDDALRLYTIPPTDALIAAGGGRRDTYLAELPKDAAEPERAARAEGAEEQPSG